MSDFAEIIQNVLVADATLVSIATGGIYSLNDIGRQGLSRTTTPNAFTNVGLIKPSIIVKQRSSVPFGDIVDEAANINSGRVMVEIWLYEDTGYATITQMNDRVLYLLNNKKHTRGICYWVNEIREERDTKLDASVERIDFEILHLRGTS